MPHRFLEVVTETKCRRCGKLEEWQCVTPDWYDDKSSLSFVNKIDFLKTHPESHWCKKCKKNTLQDLVAYEFIYDQKESTHE
jgi:hypothetical protein